MRAATSLPAFDGQKGDAGERHVQAQLYPEQIFQGPTFSTFYDQVGDGEKESEEDGEQQRTEN